MSVVTRRVPPGPTGYPLVGVFPKARRDPLGFFGDCARRYGDIVSMRLGAHHPMGPLELADFIGLDTCLSVMQVLHEGLADSKYRPCPLLVKYVEAGWVGKKVKRGFYDYSGERPVPTR